MAPRLELHELPGSKRAGELAMLVEALYKQHRRVVVWIADEGRLQIMDDYLWTFRRLSFVPHAVWSPETGDMEEPVALVNRPVNPNRAEVLLVGDELPPPEWAATFEEIHDLIPSGEAGEERREFWARWQEDQAVDGGTA